MSGCDRKQKKRIKIVVHCNFGISSTASTDVQTFGVGLLLRIGSPSVVICWVSVFIADPGQLVISRLVIYSRVNDLVAHYQLINARGNAPGDQP